MFLRPFRRRHVQCYFIDPIKREISQPMKNGVPVAKICEKLKKKSSEICSLRFSSAGTTKSEDVADFAKLRVPQVCMECALALFAREGAACLRTRVMWRDVHAVRY